MDVVLAMLSVLLGAVTVGAILTAELSRARARSRLGGLRDVDLGHYEIAYLAGGPARVADVAIGLLAGEGEIRVSRGGKLHQVSTAVSAGYPVEERVLAIVAKGPGSSVVRVKRSVAESAEVAEIRDRLVGLGLLVNPRGTAGFRVSYDVLKMIPMVAAAAVAINVIYMMVQRSPALSVAALAGFGASWLVARKAGSLYVKNRPVTLGRTGRYQLEKARQAHPYGVVTDMVAMPLALYGLSHLGDPDLAAELSKRSIPDGHRYPADAGGPRANSGSPTPRESDGAGSSCASGSCGGGGCGGGGGGS
ncbi:TIGR04222 domain-containing membrane protein [Nonomuraea sp. H19]|uniref:TIGR04222 domain-containing membrane protein n=1 Tax=Nonomuraea sp. H19 TaxID=3452206 RepID=UPI003F88F805